MHDHAIHINTADEVPCTKCGSIDLPAIAPGNGPHAFRAQCRHCGYFLQWLSTHSPAERQARRQHARREVMATRPPSERQLKYLQTLGDGGTMPGSMLAASERIDALLRGEVVR